MYPQLFIRLLSNGVVSAFVGARGEGPKHTVPIHFHYKSIREKVWPINSV